MKAWEAKAGLFAIGYADDRVNVSADVEVIPGGVPWVVDDADVRDVKVVGLSDFRGEVFDLFVVVAFYEGERDFDFLNEAGESCY